MTEQQYARANRRVMLAAVIIFGYVALTMATALAVQKDGNSGKILIQLITSVLVIIMSVLGYLFRKRTHAGEVLITTAMAVGYVVVHTAQFCKRDLGICGSSGHCRDDIHEHAAYDDR